MGLFGTVSGKQVDEFAKALVRELSTQCPPAGADAGHPTKATPKLLLATLESIFAKALGFKTQHKLGVYKKARLGNTFRWELSSLGYEKRFVEDVTQRLIVHIARKR